MTAKLEKLDGSRVKLTVNIDAETLEKSMEEAYRKNVKNINIPGFRKGKAPRQIIELNYGPDIFLEDAVEILLPRAYEKAVQETEINPVDQPEADLEEIARGEGATFTFTVDVYPELKLGNYKNLEVERELVNIEDDAVEDVLKQQQESASQLVVADHTTVQEGDFCVFDFTGYIDGKPFSGGAGEDQTLEIGSGQFIPGFEDQMIGLEVGETSEIQVTFPEEYHAEELAGKEATFKVTIKELKEKVLPELDDEFAKDISEHDTLEELRAEIRKNLVDEATRRTNDQMENRLLELIAEDSQVEIPQSMIEHQAEHQVQHFLQRFTSQGMREDLYFDLTGQTREDLLKQFEPAAETQIIHDLILEAIREEEGITVSEEEVNDQIQEYLDANGELTPELEENMREYWDSQRRGIELTIARKKAMQVIVDNAQITEVESIKSESPEEIVEPETSEE